MKKIDYKHKIGDKVRLNFGKAGKLKAKISKVKTDKYHNISYDCLLILDKNIGGEISVTVLKNINSIFINK